MMLKLDSFVHETARLHSPALLFLQRKVLSNASSRYEPPLFNPFYCPIINIIPYIIIILLYYNYILLYIYNSLSSIGYAQFATLLIYIYTNVSTCI